MPYIKVVFFDLGETLVGSHRNWLPGAQETLTSLRQKQIRLGLISNTADLPRPAIIDLMPGNFDLAVFEEDLVVFSSEVHVAKPDPEIFRLAVQRAAVEPDECLFCTEDLSHIAVAKQEGLQTVPVRNPSEGDIGELPGLLIERGLLPN